MCKYFDKCPSKTAVCLIEEPSGECVPFILAAYEKLKAGNDHFQKRKYRNNGSKPLKQNKKSGRRLQTPAGLIPDNRESAF